MPGRRTARPRPERRRGTSASSAKGRERGPPSVQVPVVESADALQVFLEVEPARGGEHGDAVLGPFAVADGELVPFEVDVLYAQLQTFEESKTGAVEDRPSSRCPAHGLEELPDFAAAQHDGEVLRGLGPFEALEPSQVQT